MNASSDYDCLCWHSHHPHLTVVIYLFATFYLFPCHICGKPDGAVVKNLPANQETQVWFLGQEDPWRKKWQPTPVFLPGKFHGQRNRWSTVCGVTRVGHDLATKPSVFYTCSHKISAEAVTSDKGHWFLHSSWPPLLEALGHCPITVSAQSSGYPPTWEKL